MRSFAGADVPYPNAALIFVPTVPPGSTIPGDDFKVSIGGLSKLPAVITPMKRDGWSLDQRRAFAAHHRLLAIPSIDAALSPQLLDDEQLLSAYGEAFIRTYGGLTSEWSMSCVCESEELSSEVVVECSAQGDNVLLTGPSGCGKSCSPTPSGSPGWRAETCRSSCRRKILRKLARCGELRGRPARGDACRRDDFRYRARNRRLMPLSWTATTNARH